MEEAHPCEIVEGTPLHDVVGKTDIMVNSWHFRCVKPEDIMGTKLQAAAYDDEGNVEVAFDPNKTMYWAVQFHPELRYKTDDSSLKIVNHILEVAQENRQLREKEMAEQAKYDTATAVLYRRTFGPVVDSLENIQTQSLDLSGLASHNTHSQYTT